MSLNGKVAIVTGAIGGLGRVVVKTLLDHGVHVVTTFRSELHNAQHDRHT